jgi:hypothetical protein
MSEIRIANDEGDLDLSAVCVCVNLFNLHPLIVIMQWESWSFLDCFCFCMNFCKMKWKRKRKKCVIYNFLCHYSVLTFINIVSPTAKDHTSLLIKYVDMDSIKLETSLCYNKWSLPILRTMVKEIKVKNLITKEKKTTFTIGLI